MTDHHTATYRLVFVATAAVATLAWHSSRDRPVQPATVVRAPIATNRAAADAPFGGASGASFGVTPGAAHRIDSGRASRQAAFAEEVLQIQSAVGGAEATAPSGAHPVVGEWVVRALAATDPSGRRVPLLHGAHGAFRQESTWRFDSSGEASLSGYGYRWAYTTGESAFTVTRSFSPWELPLREHSIQFELEPSGRDLVLRFVSPFKPEPVFVTVVLSRVSK